MSETKGFIKSDEALAKGKSDEELLSTFKSWFEAAKKNRQLYDFNWYLYDNYYRGNHYIQFNRRTNQVVTPPRPKGQVRLTVNKIYSICRAIRNFATGYRPRWSVAANSTSENSLNNDRKSAETLDFYYKHLHIPRLVKGLSLYLEKYGIGYFQYGWDEEAEGQDGQMGECDIWIRDPFDVYLDPSGMETGNIQNCRFIDIAVSKPIQEIIDNPHYSVNPDEISGDTVRAASEFKQILIKNQYLESFESNSELATKILHETWYKKQVKVPVTDSNGKATSEKKTETQVWIASWVEGKLLRNEQTEWGKYPIIAVSSDDNPNEVYGEGYIKNLIPIIKVLNRLESQIVEYNNLINRGRYVVDKNSGLTKITNETGEILEKNAGSSVEALHPGGLSTDIDKQIMRMNHYLEEISGVREAFIGGLPAGIRSGVALESLKAQTANNLQDLKDNLELGLAQLGEGILELVANKYLTARTIKGTDKTGNPTHFKVKGQVGVQPNDAIPKDTYIIGNQNQVSVVIGSDLAYTREGRITRLDKLLEQKVIDPQTYLEALEFGDVDQIMQRSQQSQFNSAMLTNIQKNGMPGTQPPGQPPLAPQAPPPQQASPQGGQPQDSWTKLADDEDMAMLKGQVIPPTKDAPKEHTAVHIAWSQSSEVQGNEHLLKSLFDHIKGEEVAQGAPHAALEPSSLPTGAAPQ